MIIVCAVFSIRKSNIPMHPLTVNVYSLAHWLRTDGPRISVSM